MACSPIQDARFAMAYSSAETFQSKSEQVSSKPRHMYDSFGSWEIWRRCNWPSALEAAALALESLGQHSEAALHISQAISLHHQGNVTYLSNNHWYQPLMDRLMAYLTVSQKRALLHGGASGLFDCMEQEREEALPEIRRTRPKNYYYERWMSGRVEREIPGLPPCIISALVKKLDADDLDLMLIHPLGLSAQVTEMLHVLTEKGQKYLADEFKPERLTWEEVKCLTGPSTVGLPIAYSGGIQDSSGSRILIEAMTEDERVRLEGQVNEEGQLRYRCNSLLKEARLMYETKQLPWTEDRLVLGFPAGGVHQGGVSNKGSCSDIQQVDQASRLTTRRDIIIGVGKD